MIASLSLNIGSSKKEKKARYDITNVSLKNISKLIKAFEKVTYEGYVRKRPKIEKHVNRVSKTLEPTIYLKYLMSMNILAVVTTPYTYHGCSTRKTFSEGKFTPMNMKIVVITLLGYTGR